MLTEDGEGCRYDGPLEYVSMSKWQFVVLRAGLERACRVCSNVCCHLSNSIKINQSGCCFIQVATFPVAGESFLTIAAGEQLNCTTISF